MNAFEKVISKLEKGKATVNVAETIRAKKPEKTKGEVYPVDPDWEKPNIYTDDKKLPGAANVKAGDVLYILCECKVKNINDGERIENGKVDKSRDVTLVIEKMGVVD
jgi:hypothetical protein